MLRRYTDAEIEEAMVPKLVEAIYPLMIPMEQQDVAIQAANRERVTMAARLAWRSFAGTLR